MTPACCLRSGPVSLVAWLKVPEASTATYASNPAAVAEIAGSAAHTSSDTPAKISFYRPVASMAPQTRSPCHAAFKTALQRVADLQHAAPRDSRDAGAEPD